MIELIQEASNTNTVLESVASTRSGAVVLFLGTTREFTAGRQTASLDYESYGEMAQRKMEELEAEARQRWSLIEVTLVHRLGHVGLGEASVAIAVSSPHRGDAFTAGQWLIDTLKEIVPIWKKENWADGTNEWVHPGMPSPTCPGTDSK